MFRQFGLPELAIILVIVLLLFGATRLPQVGKSLGSSMLAFKRAVTGEDEQEPQSTKSESESDKAVSKGSER